MEKYQYVIWLKSLVFTLIFTVIKISLEIDLNSWKANVSLVFYLVCDAQCATTLV